MANATTPPLPGTPFSPLAGWQDLMTAVAVLVAVGVVVLLVVGAVAAVDGRSDWQGWLQARSRRQPPTPGAGTGPRAGGGQASKSTVTASETGSD